MRGDTQKKEVRSDFCSLENKVVKKETVGVDAPKKMKTWGLPNMEQQNLETKTT